MAKVALSTRLIGLADGLSKAATWLLIGIRRHLGQVSPIRAGGEASLLVAALLALVLAPMKVAPDAVIPATFLLFSLAGGTWAGLRMCQAAGSWRKSLLREALLSLPLAAFLVLICAGILWMDGAGWLFERNESYLLAILPAIGMCIPAFLIVRALARFWTWWDAQRKRRFLWAFTHAQMTVIVLIGLLLMLIGLGVIGYTVHTELQNLASLPGDPPYSVFMQVIVWLLGLALLTLIFIGLGSLLLFPAALFFSYLVARGLTQRVETLAQAAARLQDGDFSVRVAVEGMDELAQLQEAFNRMAADLQERTRELEVRTGELQAERDRTAGLLEAQRELTASVSHELRTPVATARTYLDALLERPDTAPPDGRRDLEILSSEVGRLERLIDDLFSLSRAEVDRLSLNLGPVPVEPLLERLVEITEKQAWERRRVQVMLVECPETLIVRADPNRLEQILRNLVQNSLRHTPPGGCVQVSAAYVELSIRIRVEDTGEGILPEDLPHIWERFYRAEAARRAGEGSGLGLALVKELTEAMGGQVGVASTPGEGSVFWIDLPAG